MLPHRAPAAKANSPGFQAHATLARTESEMQEAQRLRYVVFHDEMGAPGAGETTGLDADIFDPYCDHLLVRDGRTQMLVGTCRLLSAAQAKKIGGYHLEQEFHLTRLRHFSDRMVEIGRFCIHPDYRDTAAIPLMWAALAEYMKARRLDCLVGGIHIGMADGGHTAASLYNRLRAEHPGPIEWHVFPRHPLPLEHLRQDLDIPTPPVAEGYLRAGAYICGGPVWEPDLNTALIPVFLPMARPGGHLSKSI